MFSLRRRDENEGPIVLALQAIGAVVTRLNDWGVTDLLVGYRGRTILIEVKKPDTHQQSARSAKTKRAKGTDGPSENAKGQLTPPQVKWWSAWIGGEAYVVETPEQAVAIARGTDLPADVMVCGVCSDGTPYVDLAHMGVTTHRRLTADQADALAGALHEQAGVARALARRRQDG